MEEAIPDKGMALKLNNVRKLNMKSPNLLNSITNWKRYEWNPLRIMSTKLGGPLCSYL